MAAHGPSGLSADVRVRLLLVYEAARPAGGSTRRSGYGLPLGSRLVGTPRFSYRTSMLGREYRWGYALGAFSRDTLDFELGVDAQRRESPLAGGPSQSVMVRTTAQW